MKKTLLPALLLFLFTGPAFADLYQWKDEQGVIHITDSMEKVPSKYRAEVRIFKEGAKEAPGPGVDVETPPNLEQEAEDLYGDQTLEWWRQSFQKKRSELSDLQASITAKTQFMEVYESGRRFGQVFDTENVARYNILKEELPADLKRLTLLREEYSEFQDKAVRAGVPREIREP
jgi:hypothetical protein